MKKIKLHYYSTPVPSATYQRQKLFHFYLGNQVTITIKNEKKLLTIISAINEELNLHLTNINSIYIELLMLHRKRWFILDHENNNHDQDHSIRESLREIEKSMDLAINNTNYPNANFFTFKHLNSMLKECESILKTFIDIDIRQHNTQEMQYLKATKKRVNSLRKEVNSLGSEY